MMEQGSRHHLSLEPSSPGGLLPANWGVYGPRPQSSARPDPPGLAGLTCARPCWHHKGPGGAGSPGPEVSQRLLQDGRQGHRCLVSTLGVLPQSQHLKHQLRDALLWDSRE